MKTTRDFRPMSERYDFDFGPCSYENGFAQIDTDQDASYFGIWANPFTLTVVSFCEGDLTAVQCDSADEFTAHMCDLADWSLKNRKTLIKIDPGFTDRPAGAAMKDAFVKLGLADLLHGTPSS